MSVLSNADHRESCAQSLDCRYNLLGSIVLSYLQRRGGNKCYQGVEHIHITSEKIRSEKFRGKKSAITLK